jgi:hypothetical protein
MPAPDIREVIKGHADRIMSIDGVVGIARGMSKDNQNCILILVIKDTPELRKRIPGQLEGYPVLIEETGEISAFSDEEEE